MTSELDPTPLRVAAQDGRVFAVSRDLRTTPVLTGPREPVALAALDGRLYGVTVRGEVFEGHRRGEPLGAVPVALVPCAFDDGAGARSALAVVFARSTVSYVDPQTLSPLGALVEEPLTPTGACLAGAALLVSTAEARLLRAEVSGGALWSYPVPAQPLGTAPLRFWTVVAVGSYAVCGANRPTVYVYRHAALEEGPRDVELEASPCAALVPWRTGVLYIGADGATFLVDPETATRARLRGACAPGAVAAASLPGDVLALLTPDRLCLYRLPAAPGARLLAAGELELGDLAPAAALAVCR